MLSKKNEEKELEEAISYLKESYWEIKELDWVKNPIAYALYYTWRKFDRRKGGRLWGQYQLQC